MTTLTVRIPDGLNKLLEKFCEREERNKSWFLKKGLKILMEDMSDYHIAELQYSKYIHCNEVGVDLSDLAKEQNIKLKNYKKKK